MPVPVSVWTSTLQRTIDHFLPSHLTLLLLLLLLQSADGTPVPVSVWTSTLQRTIQTAAAPSHITAATAAAAAVAVC
jgi:hypothetical protein